MYSTEIAKLFGIQDWQVKNTLTLLEEGATVPFISRYRKERTGSLDEVEITNIKEEFHRLSELNKRKEAVIQSIDEQEKLTPELKQKIESATAIQEVEDLYLPYKPKRKTRGDKAKEKGLEGLAKIIMAQNSNDVMSQAVKFLNEEVENEDEALQGAIDIIAEWVNEHQYARNRIRKLYERESFIESKVVKKKEEDENAAKYKDYFDWSELLRKSPAHRVLAMRRGENEGFLRIKIAVEEEKALDVLNAIFVKGNLESSQYVGEAVKESFKRLLAPSMETEFKSLYKEKADESSIQVFADNLRQLLLAPPLGQKRTLAIDPGYRTGCKIVCLDAQGKLLHNETVYPHPPQNEQGKAIKKISSLVNSHNIEAIAIGNGTASRDTEQLVRRIKFDRDLQVFVVSENGASVYSASTVAREEFPEYDVTVRGAVSIGRRLMDPLAELVKIDPKSIGVGQYQHDVDQTRLKEKLDQVVESCVNLVGVNVNTASKHILTYISGLGPQLAQNIINYRAENGPFQTREDIKNVKRMGAKAFEQAAGFLRVENSENPLDNSAVHPESYEVAEKMAGDLNCTVTDLINDKELRAKIKPQDYVHDDIGLPTINDILEELDKPGRDPRQQIKVFEFSSEVSRIEDLKPGMVLPGIVTNITNFGAFVDVGVKQDGLVHISQLANRFVSDPSEIVKLHQQLKVKVLDVDVARKRIQLSLKDLSE